MEFKYIFYIVTHLVIAADFVLDLKGKTTLSEVVWSARPLRVVWYLIGLVGFSLAFWLHSTEAAAWSLFMWLSGHFAR